MTPEQTSDLPPSTPEPAESSAVPLLGPPAPPRVGPPSAPRFPVARHLASGGLGDVFVAGDAELPREVALKRLRAHRADDPRARAEFVREARLTGALEHPGVVPVYSLGTDDTGEPYYAMRLIGGETLEAASRRLHASAAAYDSLPFRQLLQRFVAVCQAVTYAHSRGVIHRDLKPANVMIGAFGETLVVDWGLAKHVTQGTDDTAGPHLPEVVGTAATADGTVKGTVAYMPPEQAAGRVAELGPAADIYALGAILFHLLTGKPPLMGEWATDHVEALARGDIPAPRDRAPGTPAALDAVCRRSMAAEPARRYASAADLAADVERYLADEPVSAYRAPLPARAARWARKHPGAVSGVGATLAVGLVALAVGFAVVGGKNAELRASEAREREARAAAEASSQLAEARFTLARDAVEKYLGAVTEDDELQANGLYVLRKRLLETAMPFFVRLTEEAGESAERRAAQAAAHLRLGLIARETGDVSAAVRAFEASNTLRTALAAESPDEPEHRHALTTGLSGMGILSAETGDVAAARRHFDSALKLCEKLAADSPRDYTWEVESARVYDHLGRLADATGDRAAARESFAKTVAVCERVSKRHPEATECRRLLAGVYMYRGVSLAETGDPAAALAEFRAAESQLKVLFDRDPKSREFRARTAKVRQDIGAVLGELGDVPSALTELEAALDLLEKLVDEFPVLSEYRRDLCTAHNMLGLTRASGGNPKAAEAEFRTALALAERLVADRPKSDAVVRERGAIRCNLGQAVADQGRHIDALAHLDAALADLDRAARLAPENPLTIRFRFNSRIGRAQSLDRLSRFAESAEVWAALAEDFPEDANLPELAAAASAKTGRLEDAMRYLLRSRDLGAFRAAGSAYALARDPDFAAMRDRPDFRALLASLEPETLPVPRR